MTRMGMFPNAPSSVQIGKFIHVAFPAWFLAHKWRILTYWAERESPLSPAQWLPKPATSQIPETRRALRASWSPRGGEGEGLR